jgi:hypothetical protein
MMAHNRPCVGGGQGGAVRVLWIASLCAALVIALLLSPFFLTSRKDRFWRRDETIAKMSDLAEVMISLRDRDYDLTTVHNIDDLLKMADSAKLIPRPSQYYFVKDAWESPFIWCICKASTGDVEVSIVSCGQNRTFEQGEGDDITFAVSLSGKGKGTLRYDSATKTNWPPTPSD